MPLPWWTSQSTISDAPDAVLALRIARRDGDVVEQAEAHAAIRRGVMAGRTHDAERVARLALDTASTALSTPPAAAQRDIERVAADVACRRCSTS